VNLTFTEPDVNWVKAISADTEDITNIASLYPFDKG
jgi:hypothetical protein